MNCTGKLTSSMKTLLHGKIIVHVKYWKNTAESKNPGLIYSNDLELSDFKLAGMIVVSSNQLDEKKKLPESTSLKESEDIFVILFPDGSWGIQGSRPGGTE